MFFFSTQYDANREGIEKENSDSIRASNVGSPNEKCLNTEDISEHVDRMKCYWLWRKKNKIGD